MSVERAVRSTGCCLLCDPTHRVDTGSHRRFPAPRCGAFDRLTGHRVVDGRRPGVGPGFAKIAGAAPAASRSVFMKPIKSLLVLAIVCAPALAAAQGYYGRGGQAQPVPGGFHNRTGRLTVGGSIGLGGMSSNGDSLDCRGCDIKPFAFEADAHIGGVVNPRVALMLELQVNSQQVQSDFINGDTYLTQGAAMFAGQFWIIPQLWIKGGLGFSQLQVDDDYYT